MKKLVLIGLICLFIGSVANAQGVQRVNGYYRSNGTYVQPYNRTTPNNTQWDNWSTKGNVNPNTLQPGTVTPQYGNSADRQLYNQNKQNNQYQYYGY